MFVIPMAGLSSRFFKAGFSQPKYQLLANGKTLFTHAVESFSHYFDTDHFLFIVRSEYNTPAFVRTEAEALGLRSFDIVVLDAETRGQAETVALGIEKYHQEPLFIFNIDTFRPGYRKPGFCNQVQGYLETFIGSGKNWSNIEPLVAGSDRVKRTAEKKEISEFCCSGLYHWDSAARFKQYYQQYCGFDQDKLDAGELYIAPMYNLAISAGDEIRYTVIQLDEVIFCGTPDEYQQYLDRFI